MAERLALDAILVDPNEMEVVGDDDILREGLVAFDLIRLENLIEIFTDCLVLNVAENKRALGDLKIRSPLFGNSLGLVLNRDPAVALACNRLLQGLERCAIRMLGFLINRSFPERQQIAIEDILVGCHC